MGIIASLIAMAELALELWVSKDKRKYIDELADIKKEYYEEWNKPRASRNRAKLDNLKFRLRVVTASIAADARK